MLLNVTYSKSRAAFRSFIAFKAGSTTQRVRHVKAAAHCTGIVPL